MELASPVAGGGHDDGSSTGVGGTRPEDDAPFTTVQAASVWPMMNFAAYLPSGDMTEEKWGILLSSVADAMRVANTSPRGLCDAAHAEWVLAAIIDTHAQPTAMNKRHAVFTKNNWANTPFSKAQLRHALKWCKETTGEGEEKAGVFANMMGGLAASKELSEQDPTKPNECVSMILKKVRAYMTDTLNESHWRGVHVALAQVQGSLRPAPRPANAGRGGGRIESQRAHTQQRPAVRFGSVTAFGGGAKDGEVERLQEELREARKRNDKLRAKIAEHEMNKAGQDEEDTTEAATARRVVAAYNFIRATVKMEMTAELKKELLDVLNKPEEAEQPTAEEQAELQKLMEAVSRAKDRAKERDAAGEALNERGGNTAPNRMKFMECVKADAAATKAVEKQTKALDEASAGREAANNKNAEWIQRLQSGDDKTWGLPSVIGVEPTYATQMQKQHQQRRKAQAYNEPQVQPLDEEAVEEKKLDIDNALGQYYDNEAEEHKEVSVTIHSGDAGKKANKPFIRGYMTPECARFVFGPRLVDYTGHFKRMKYQGTQKRMSATQVFIPIKVGEVAPRNGVVRIQRKMDWRAFHSMRAKAAITQTAAVC